MTQVPNSEFTGRMGVGYVTLVCGSANMIFRSQNETDIGIDGLFEVVSAAGFGSGKLAGVQIKSGDSFVNLATRRFTFSAAKKNFEYWNQHCLPVIGVVFSPSLNTGVWFDLKRYSRDVVLNDYPCQISLDLQTEHEFNASNVATLITDHILQYHGRLLAKNEIEEIAASDDKVSAWKRLTNILFDSKNDVDVLGEVAYRLSWHFPSEMDERSQYFIDRMRHASDDEIVNIVGAIHGALELGRDDVSTLIGQLFRYLPNHVERLKSLARGREVPKEWLEALFQSVELFTQDLEEVFRDEIAELYQIES